MVLSKNSNLKPLVSEFVEIRGELVEALGFWISAKLDSGNIFEYA